MEQLLQEIIRYFENWVDVQGAGFAQLTEILTQMPSPESETKVIPKTRPIVTEWLDESVQGATHPLVIEFANQSRKMSWDTVSDDYLGKEFAQQFAFTQIVGPWEIEGQAPIYSAETIAVGFSLQAPNLFYAPHNHKAIEFYSPLSGTARWQLGHNPPQAQSPGSTIFHDSDVPHAIETAEEPLLCLWAWAGDLDSPIEVPSLNWLEAN